MRIILTQSFLKKEYKDLSKYYSVDDIKDFVSRFDGKFIDLSSLGYKDGRLVKLKITKKIASRMIAYIFVSKDLFVPLIFRLKKDKLFGENLSVNNKPVKSLIIKMMDLAIIDIKNNDFEE